MQKGIFQPSLLCKTNCKINNRDNIIFFIFVSSIKTSVASQNRGHKANVSTSNNDIYVQRSWRAGSPI